MGRFVGVEAMKRSCHSQQGSHSCTLESPDTASLEQSGSKAVELLFVILLHLSYLDFQSGKLLVGLNYALRVPLQIMDRAPKN